MYPMIILVFICGIHCENSGEEDIVGMGQLAKLRLAKARAKVLHDLTLAKIRAHRIPHLLLAKNPNLDSSVEKVDWQQPASTDINRTNYTNYSTFYQSNDKDFDDSINTKERISNRDISFTRLHGVKNIDKDEQLFVWSLNNLPYTSYSGFREAYNNQKRGQLCHFKYIFPSLILDSCNRKVINYKLFPVLYLTTNEDETYSKAKINLDAIYNKFNKLKQEINRVHIYSECTKCKVFGPHKWESAPFINDKLNYNIVNSPISSQVSSNGQLKNILLPNGYAQTKHTDDELLNQVHISNGNHGQNGSDVLGKPYLFHFPANNMRINRERFKRSDEMWKNYKRPLLTLITDPNMKLDISKTVENIGTITKKSLENENAPMIHVKNLLGSVKNAALSILKIPPQDVIIPSQYKIVDRNRNFVPKRRIYNDKLGIPSILSRHGDSDILMSRDNLERNNLDDQVLDTFQILGTIAKESIRAGRETLHHIGDVAHSARKIIVTTRDSAPTILLPYINTPVIRNDARSDVMLLTSRFADTEDENNEDVETNDYVALGDIMDALGISNPNQNDVTSHPKYNDLKPTINLKSKFGSNDILKNSAILGENNDQENISSDEVKKAFHILQKFKKLIESEMPTDFLVYLGNKSAQKTSNSNVMEQIKLENNYLEHDAELNQFLTKLFTTQKIKDLGRSIQEHTLEKTVGDALPLDKDLLKPFMGKQAHKENTKTKTTIDFEKRRELMNRKEPLRYFFQNLNAEKKMNPEASRKSMKNRNLNEDEYGVEVEEIHDDESKELRMNIHKDLLKPFMGRPSHKKIEEYLDQYY